MALKHVDPSRRRGALERRLFALGRSRFGRWYGINVAARVDSALLRRTGGRISMVGILPTALLETTGARSGARRETPVLYFHDGADVVLIASSFGRDRHPGWYHNLRAHPDCALNGKPYLSAEVTDPDEYERLFALGVRNYPGYADYRRRTEALGRHIPVLRLKPVR